MASQFSVTAAEIRDMCQDVNSTDVADADINNIVEDVESLVFTLTNKSDWASTDDAFKMLRGAVKDGSASKLIGYLGDPNTRAPFLWDRFMSVVKLTQTESQVGIARTTYYG